MESKKVKEIKKVLEEGQFNTITHHQKEGKPILVNFADILTLINELESENESCYEVLADLKAIIKQQNDRIAELEKENMILQGTKNRLTFTDRIKIADNARTIALKQFAERLQEKCEFNYKEYCCEATVSANDIDETLKELQGE